MNELDTKSNSIYAIVAYLTIIGTLIAYFMNKDTNNKLVVFHVKQALGLWLIFFVLGYIVSGFSNWTLTYAFWIFFSVLFLYGLFGAFSNKYYAIPLLGNLFQKLFKALD